MEKVFLFKVLCTPHIYILKRSFSNGMAEKQIKRFQVGEIKSAIIEYILANLEPVSEPAIRLYLKEKYDVHDHGTINKHLHKLEELGCVESVKPDKKTRSNYWDIKKLKNMQNIRHEFPDTRLNIYEKSINLILFEFSHSLSNFEGLKFYIQLLLSPSLFDICLETGFEKIHENVAKIYRESKGFERHQKIENLLKKCYQTCISLNRNLTQSEKLFIDNMYYLPWEHISMCSKEYIVGIFQKYLSIVPEEIPNKIFYTKLSGIESISTEIPEVILSNELTKYMLNAIRMIKDEKCDLEFSRDDILLETCFHWDLLNGIDLPKEAPFVRKIKENHERLTEQIEDYKLLKQKIKSYDAKIASEIILHYKKPSEFYISDNSQEIYEKLTDFYNLKTFDFNEFDFTALD